MVFLHLLLVCVVGLAAVGTARGQESVYQITFKDHTTVAQVNAVIETLENDYAITIIKAYHFDIFSVLSVSGTAENIDSAAGLPNIEYIEKDGNTGAAEAGECTEIDSPGTWGLDRIDQKNKLISSDELDKRAQYLLGPYTGQEHVYQITFKDHTTVAQVNAVIETLETDYAIAIIKVYHFDIFSVLSVSGTTENIDHARELPNIEYIEEDGNAGATEAGECTEIDSPGTWGLDRIDQENELIGYDELDEGAQYLLGPYRGAGVTAYIIDGGIDVTHPEFGGRAFHGYTVSGIAHAGDNDDTGHGTHVAGIIGSTSYGIAKDVTLVAVKALGTGRLDPIFEGLQWVYEQLVARDEASVVILPWIIPKNEGLNKVVLSMVRKKGVIVAAAGNVAREACNWTPASAPATTTVASMNIYDIASNSSNWGGCVHIFAPGLNILSTWPGASTKVMSGTSMAAAHVAGVAALKLSKEDMSSGQMRAWLVRRSWKNILTYPNDDQKKTPNRLLFLDCELK